MKKYNTSIYTGRWSVLAWMLLSLALAVKASSPPETGMVLRVRTANGSMERLQIPPGVEDKMSLQEALSSLRSDSKNEEQLIIKIGSSTIEDATQTLSNLGLRQGSLVSLLRKTGDKAKAKGVESYFSSKNTKSSDRWDPFPELAKDYDSAARKTKVKRASQSGMSFGDLANLQSSLHVIEPQQEGPLKRVYMCSNSAQRFHVNGFKKKGKNEFECRLALVLGTVQRERVDLKPKARTSLSSQTESSQYCDVVKVHALWEPPQQPTKTLYDAKPLLVNFTTDEGCQRVLRIATLLGIRPVGWVFTYNDNRHEGDDSLPVHAQDAKAGASLQIANMKHMGRIDGSRFVTLPMDASTGSTEAFQLSDVCVQMIAEDLWEDKGVGRFVPTKHAVIVDGKETKELDSVLCLVNTAMLSHKGSFSGPTTNSVKKAGGFTNKVKKSILSALDTNNDSKLLETLCDLNLLLSLDKTLSSSDTDEICGMVRKWARGQKKGTELSDRLKMLLRSILGH